MQRARKHDVRVLGGFAQEEIDDREELELLQGARYERVVGQGDLRIEADGEQALDLARVDLPHHLVAIDAGLRQLVRLHAPYAGHVFAMCRIGDVAPAGKLLRLLTVLPPPLPVALTDDSSVRAARFSDAAGREDDVDGGEAILDAVRMVLDAARVHEEARFRGAPKFRRRANALLRDTRDFRRAARRPLLDVLVEADGVLLDELVIEPVVLDHEVKDAVEQRHVAAGLHRKEEIRGARDRRDARIDHDDLPAVLARLPDVVRGDRRALRGVRSGDQHDLGVQDVVPRIGAAVDAERLLVRRAGADHAQPAVVIDVFRLQAYAGELAHQVCLLRRQTGAGEHAHGVRAVRRLDAVDLRGHARNGGVVRQRREPARGLGIALKSGREAVRMSALEISLHPLRAKHPFVERKVVARLEADHQVVFDFEIDAALLAAEAAMRRNDLVGLGAGVDAQSLHAIEVRTPRIHENFLLFR